jgi:hypothetical protein
MITEAERAASDARFADAQRQQAFNRAADLNVTQIMERIGSVEVSVNNLQNNLMTSIIKFLHEQQEQAANDAETRARVSMLETHAVAQTRDFYVYMQRTRRALTWGIAALGLLAFAAIMQYGSHLIGG